MTVKVCAIAGVGPGMGLSLCRRFGREGFHVAMIARTRSRLTDAAERLHADGIAHSIHVADVTDRKAVSAVFQRLGADVGAPEVLIYNAFHRMVCQPSMLTEQDVLESVRVNVVGALHCVRQVASDMRYKGRGTVLFTGGGSAVDPPPQVAALGIGKAGLRNLCFSLARELEPHGVHVATVTIFDHINPGTHFDPDRIAEAFWTLYQQPREAWEREIDFRAPAPFDAGGRISNT